MIARIQSLMALFTKLTGNPVVSTYATQGEAREWLNAEAMKDGRLEKLSEDDLKLMVAYRRATVDKRDSHILKAMLRWRFIIGDVQRFAEDLPEARAWARNKQKAPTPKEKVLALTGRVKQDNGEAKTAGQVLREMSPAGLAAFEQLKAFRQTLEQS